MRSLQTRIDQAERSVSVPEPSQAVSLFYVTGHVPGTSVETFLSRQSHHPFSDDDFNIVVTGPANDAGCPGR